MTRLALTGGAYQARAIIASAQRCLNLYPEPMPEKQGEPAMMAHYPTPGLRLLATLPQGPVRGLRQVATGQVYAVAGNGVYALDTSWNPTLIGTITSGLTTPVSMADNGVQLVIVDGSQNGWSVTIATNAFAVLLGFGGGTMAAYLDTFFLFSVPDTPQFQSSLSLSVTFDPLYFANKSASSDLLAGIVVAHREIWLIGTRTSEVWYNTGAADFPFQAQPGVFVAYGACAPYSIVEITNTVFWLSRDRNGQGMVMQSSGYNAHRISTFAIEAALSSYATISDAVAWAYQQQGHIFYVLNFPTADKTWVYDMASELWHERCWLDSNGAEHRHRGNCAFLVNNVVTVGDWQTGALYALDPAVFDDAGAPIKRQRSFPHLLADGRRVFYRQFLADMTPGTALATTDDTAPIVYLDWSDDRGRSFGNPVAQSLGASGEYLMSLQYQRLGMARDRVFRLTWSSPSDTALQGAFIDAAPAQS